MSPPIWGKRWVGTSRLTGSRLPGGARPRLGGVLDCVLRHVTVCRAWKRASRQRPVARMRCSVSAARQVSVKLM